jgi:oligoribonuclease NrnB/cAMP/cGMP phosphodiesterase (DHH superfamily)
MNAKELHDKLKAINYNINDIDTVLYHNNCPDGFGSAWIVWRHLKGDATYMGVVPDKLPSYTQFKNKYVVIIDISLPKKYLDDVASVAKNVMMIDHHNTYADEFGDHPNAIFDKEHSAIYITWRVFNPDEKIPQFVRYIEDNDLAKYEINKTEAFVTTLGVKIPFHHIDYFRVWDKLLNPAFVDSLLIDGQKYQEFKNYILKRNMHVAESKTLAGYKVLVANFGAVGLASDLGNKISESNPNYDFVILWSYHTANKEYSIMLRTRNDEVDLSQIAKKFGGGGHPRDARFAWKGPIEKLWDYLDTNIEKKSKTSLPKKSKKSSKSKKLSKSKKSKSK